MANRNWASGGKIYSMHVMPVLLDANVVIDSGQPSGTRSLKGAAVSSISNVGTGLYKIVFPDNYNRYYGGFSGFVSGSQTPLAITALTPGNAYIIAVLGTSTQADWVAAGLDAGITAAVGVPFIASATSIGTGFVVSPLASGISSLEVVGNPNLTLASNPQGSAYIMVQCLDFAGLPADPIDGAVLGMSFYLSNSSVLIAGE